MSLTRQLLGYGRIVAAPGVAAVCLSAAVLVALKARNGDVLVEFGAHSRTIVVAGALQVGLLQMTTLVGLVITSIAAGVLWGSFSRHDGEGFAAGLEPSALRRYSVRFTVVALTVVVAMGATALACLAVPAAQSFIHGSLPAIAPGDPGHLAAVAAHAALALAAIVAVATLVAGLLRGSPAVGVVVTFGTTFALLFLGNLLPASLGNLLPTTWIAHWLRLPGSDFGITYFWASGAGVGGRAAAGAALAILTAVAFSVSWALTDRVGRA